MPSAHQLRGPFQGGSRNFPVSARLLAPSPSSNRAESTAAPSTCLRQTHNPIRHVKTHPEGLRFLLAPRAELPMRNPRSAPPAALPVPPPRFVFSRHHP